MFFTWLSCSKSKKKYTKAWLLETQSNSAYTASQARTTARSSTRPDSLWPDKTLRCSVRISLNDRYQCYNYKRLEAKIVKERSVVLKIWGIALDQRTTTLRKVCCLKTMVPKAKMQWISCRISIICYPGSSVESLLNGFSKRTKIRFRT